jgi:ACS family hexuronate transporter-like MFS transporter
MIDLAHGAAGSTARRWKWWVSGILLLATMLNYMDRQALANLSVRITDELSLSQERYGDLELAFGWAFALGSIVFGILADRLPVRWLYPAVVVGWSAAGMLTGLCSGFWQLLACRTLLGFFEAGHWPCALRTTQSVLSREERTLGNGLLQSGGAAGAVVTPLVIRAIVGDDLSPGAWRPPFFIIGIVGAAWVAVWLASMRSQNLAPRDDGAAPGGIPPDAASAGGSAWGVWWDTCLGNRRFWALVPFVVCMNTAWHLLRAWLPKFLQQGRGASEAESLYFNSAYYVSADVGCIAAGAVSLWLVTRGLGVHRARVAVIAVCAACTALACVATSLPRGPAMYAALLVVGAGAMGLFPCYYSLAQEVSPGRVGRATGLLAMIGWLLSSPLQKAFGRMVDRTGSFDTGLAWAGFAPLAAFAILVLVWPRDREQRAG